MIKILWRTDVHLSDHTPSSRRDDWATTVMRKLAYVGDLADRIKADAVIDGGDFFDVKSPSRNSHRLVQDAVRVHRDHYNVPVYACVGNHDCKYGDRTYLPEQPLGVLFEAGTFRRLYDEHEATFKAPDGLTVRVVGVPYHGVRYDRELLSAIKKGPEDYLVVVAHLLASPSGGTMFEGEDILSYREIADLDADVFMFGHWHKDQGVTEIAPNKWIVNTGSMTRGSLSQDNLDRVPVVVQVNFSAQGIEIVRHDLPVEQGVAVFDVETHQKRVDRDTAIEDFVASIQASLVNTTQGTLADIVAGMVDVPATVRERALQYIQDAKE